ncbi:MAG: signal peptidase II [Lachnospiraceae bacterium]|nr:signal peptidase II [Lachnospiraceae bacterium]
MKNTKSKGIILIIDLIFFAILLAADQVTKILALRLQDSDDLILINGVFQLHYLENRGAAFSMLQDATWVFVVATVVMAAVIGYVLFKVPAGKRYIMWHICLTMIGAGGIGNLIDRLRLSYVIDFLYFSLIDFPVFNFADICVTVGVALLFICVIFVWKEDDMEFLQIRKKETEKD